PVGERLTVPNNRFVDAISRLPDPPIIVAPQPEAPDYVVDVIRPADLVAMRVEVFGLDLIAGKEPVLVAGEDGGHLIVHLSFQHIAERAVYEAKVLPEVPDDVGEVEDPPETAVHIPPEQARPAKGSRIVFEVAAAEEIPFSTDGILSAIARLPMAVHPLAQPRPFIVRPPLPPIGPIFGVQPGMVGVVTPDGIVVSPETSRRRGPDPTSVGGLNQLMRDRRVIRAINARLGSVPTSRLSVDEQARSITITVGDQEVEIPSFVGRGGLFDEDLRFRRRRRPNLSREPRQFETAIEAPYRLIISPSALGGWTHATDPVGAEDAEHRIELWHSRLGVRRRARDDSVSVDENSSFQRIIRAIWTRDREAMADFSQELKPAHADDPFRSSLDGADRHMLVRQSSETWIGANDRLIRPEPVEARSLYVSALGAWLNFHGAWDTDPYSQALMSSIESWDHIAPMGRDQFVKVVYPGYLWPFGHRASLVKLTERKMKDVSPSIAGLYQRMFLVIKEPVKRFTQRDLPFTEVRIVPLVTPTLNPPPAAAVLDKSFVPMVDNAAFPFILHARDHEDRAVRLTTPLTWVAAAHVDGAEIRSTHAPHATIAVDGQKIAFAAVKKGGDTIAPTAAATFDAEPFVGGSTPTMQKADITIDAVEQLSAAGPVSINYFQSYLDDGFGGASNAGEVWAELETAIELGFGQGQSSGSDKAGGFVQPDLTVAGLSRLNGTVNDLANIATGDFDPAQFLDGVLPKLFGLVDLVDILELVGLDLDDAPAVVSETLNRIEAFIDDLERAKKMVEDAVAEANKLVDRATGKATELQQQAQDALNAAQNLETLVTDAVDDVIDVITNLVDATEAAVEQALNDPLNALRLALAEVPNVAPLLPPLIRHQLESLAAILQTIVDAIDLISDIVRFVNGLGSSSAQFTYRYEWKPKMQSWPDDTNPVLELKRDSLVLAVEGRINGKGEMGVEALAELKDFSLNLLPGAELVEFRFDHLSFRAGSAGKPEVDVILSEIKFVGVLGFIEVLKELIPFDGFSDPPFLDVTASGLTAGFTQDLPNVAIGVFNLSNLSLGADVQVPFLGEMVTVGFNFCSRERPFTLAVLFIGGGGFFGLRLSPEGLVVLELSLEAGAVLAVDFGVASGSVSAMLGIYMRLEGDAGSLAGYFRLRGEVDVLGLISASIELYLELLYDFDTGKMVGRASLTVKVEVLFFSASVTIEAERQFAGSNGDPNFVDVMGLEADGTSPAWSDYCLAFAGA
ncbi:MAG: hypothetical protein ACN4GZ_13270, partial [Acidimicrobiales bacterium]